MSKKNFVAKNSSKVASKSKKSTQAKQPVIDRLVDDASESQLAATLDEVKALPEAVQQTVELAGETQKQDKDKQVADIEGNEEASDKVLSSVEPIDRGGESLLMEASTEERKDKAVAKTDGKDDGGLGDMFPLLAGLAGLAALGGGGGGNGPTNSLPPGFQGVVFDTPVTNAIVFRDINGNGKWDANEAIAVTDSNGNYSGLTGTGNIIATSLDRLVGVNAQGQTKYYTNTDSIVINGRTVTGYAVDVGADVTLNTADDFVWSGTYVIGANLQGDGNAKVYVTAVSSLITAYMAEKSVDMNTAIAELKTLFVYDANSGVSGAGANVQFLTSELNGQVTKIMGDAIARAETAGTSVQDAIKASVTALAQAAKNTTSADPIDLTSVADLQAIIFPGAEDALIKAESLALQTGTTGPAVYSVWFDEDGTHVTRVDDELSVHGYDSKTATGDFGADARPVGNITVLANEDDAHVALDVDAHAPNANVNFQAARLLVRAAGDGSTSDMNVSDGRGEVTSVNVQATGGIARDNEEQTISLTALQGTTFALNDEINLILQGGVVLYYTVEAADLLYPQNLVNKVLASYQAQIEEDDLGVKLAVANNQLSIVWADEAAKTQAELRVQDEDTYTAVDRVVGGTALYTSADLDLSMNGKITDGIEVLSSNTSADATAHIEGTLSVAGNMSVTASGTNSYAEATVNGGDTGTTVLGSVNAGDDLTVTASGDDAEAYATLNHASGRMDQVGVNSTGDDAYACADVTVEADKTLTVQSVTLVANSAQGDGADADADAYFRGETGQLGDQRNWETLNDVATDHGKLVIAGDISVTAVGAGDWAYLGVNENEEDQGYTVLGGGDIQITAQGENASADVVMRNVDGAAGDIDVVATGTSAVQGFNFLGFFDPDPRNGEKRLAAGNVIKVSVGDDFVQYTVTAPEVRNALSINALLESIVASFNTQAADKDLGVSFSSTNTGPYSNADKGLFVTWDSIRREEEATIELTQGVTITNITTTLAYEDYFVYTDGTVDSEARLDIQTENNGLNAGAVTVTAKAENAYADADILGDAGISGEITVTASEVDAEALLHVNEDGEGTTTLSGKHDISVTASAENTDAHAHLGNASGSAGDISVAATEYSADASLDVFATGEFKGESFSVVATAESSDAMGMLTGDISIHGDITATAEGTSADAEALINVYGEDSSTLGKTVAGADVGSNITVDALGTEAGAVVAIFNAAGTVGSVDVTATGTGANAAAAILGEYTVQGDITVTANETDATAWMGVPYYGMLPDMGTATLEDSDITVTATGTSADAYTLLANAAGSVDDITVTASTSSYADASVFLGTEEAKQLDIHTVTMLSSSTQSETNVMLQGNVDITSDVEITAQGLSSDASADFNGVIAVDGNMDVHATGEDSRADLAINQIADIDLDEDLDQSQSSVLGGGDIHLQASGTDATAQAIIHQASGTTGAINVDTTGDDAQAYLEVGAQADKTLRVESITLNADSTAIGGSDAWVDTYFRGETGNVSDQNRWTDLNTLSTDHGTVQVDGNISVTAEGQSDWAYLGLNDGGLGSNNDRGYTKLNQTGNSADITIRASGTDSSAEAWVNNAAGTAGDITVEATGTHEVQGFDFLYYFRPELGAALLWKDEFKITVDGETYTYVVGKNETRNAEGINALLTKVVDEFNVQAADDGITFSVDFSGPSPFAKGIFVTWDTVRDEPAQISVAHKSGLTTTDITNEAGEAQYFFVKDGTVNSDAYLELNTEYTGVTAQSLTVTADAEDSTAASDISGDVTIRGDITVTAAELDTDAYANINAEGNGLTALGGVNPSALEVHATVDGADASLVIGNASGLATSVDVRATADDTSAYLSLQALEEDGNTLNLAGNLNVIANGIDASADAQITTTGAALGTVTVTADYSRAEADLNLSASANISASSLTVTANGQSADAYASLDADSVAVRGDLRVTSTGNDADAYASITDASVLGTADARSEVLVTSNGNLSDALLNVSNASGKVSDITVSSTGTSSTATLSLDDDDSSPALTLGIVGELDVTASGTLADAQATISATTADLVDIEVSAVGTSADADLVMDIEEELSVGNVTINASSEDSQAEATLIGDATISGDISVTSDGVESVAAAHVNAGGGNTALTGNNNLTVSSTGVDSQADLHIYNASGSVDAVNVSANSNGAYSTLNVFVEAGETLSVNTVTLTADSAGTGSDADATFGSTSATSTVEIKGDIHLDATNESDWAYLGVNDGDNDQGQTILGGGDLTLHAAGEDSTADAYIYNASGDVGDISLEASDNYATASLDLTVAGTLTADSLTLEASGLESDAITHISGDVSILGDVTVTASGFDATATTMSNGVGSGTTTFGQTISGDVVGSAIDVTASGTNSMTGVNIQSVRGTVDTLTVTASGSSNLADNAVAIVNLDGDFVVQSDITFTASGTDSNIMAGVNMSGIDAPTSVELQGGNITSTASGTDAAIMSGVFNANGAVGNVDVTASGESSDALLFVSTDADALDIENINVLSSGEEAQALGLVSGDVHVTGDIHVTASGLNAEAVSGINAPAAFSSFSISPVSIETQLGDETGGSNITVVSSGQAAKAEASIGSGNGTAGNVTVSATGSYDGVYEKQVYFLSRLQELASEVVPFEIKAADRWTRVKIDGVTLQSNSLFGTPEFFNDLNLAAQTNGIDVQFSAPEGGLDGIVIDWTEFGAQDKVNFEFGGSGSRTVWQNHPTDPTRNRVAIDEASSVQGTELVNSEAGLNMHLDGNIEGNLLVEATNEFTSADAVINGEVTLEGDISVTASGTFADAVADINQNDDGSTTLTGGDITVLASGTRAFADANLSQASGSLGAIVVTASNNSADAEFDMDTEGDGITVNTLNVTASALDSYADADIDGEVRFTGDISVLASGTSADASSHMTGSVDVDGNIGVNATALYANAELAVDGTFTMSGDISANASGNSADVTIQLSDEVDLLGNFRLEASGICADANADLSNNVNISGDIHVTASGLSSDAVANLSNAVNLTGDLTVTAGGVDSESTANLSGDITIVGDINNNASGDDAFAWVEMVGSMDITGDINVTATGDDYSEALTWLNGTVVMSGDVNVAAKDEDDYATASMRNDVTLTGDINVSADGVDSNAYVDMHGDVTITGNLVAEANAYDAYTDVMMQGQVNFTGDMHFNTTAEDAMTSADINGGVDDSNSVLDVGTLRLDASGEDSITKALIDNASGTVDLVSVNATGDNSYSDLEVAVHVEQDLPAESTLTIETINVRANSDMSATGDSSTADAYLYGKTGDIPEQDRWKLLDSASTDHGTVEINGNITVTAAGTNDSAYLGVNDSGPNGETSDDGYTVVNGGNVTLAATGTDSDVETYIHNANGTLSDVSVTAGGNSEVQGFDFLHYFRPSYGAALNANDVFSFTVDGHTLTYKVKAEEIGNTTKINALLESVVASFNEQAEELHLGLQFTSSYIETERETSRLVPFEKGLFATWDSIRNEDAVVIALDAASTPLVGAVTIPGNAVDANGASYFHTNNGNENSTAYFELKTENGGVTIETLTVIASAKFSDSEAYISGDVAITGDIIVSATEIDTQASADIGGDMTDTILGHMSNDVPVGSNVTVEATNTSSNAQADINHVSGYVADLAVEATGDDSIADLFMEIEADKTLTLETITVNANSTAAGGSSAEANAYLRGENGTIAEQDRWSELNNNSTDHGTVAIEGEITVTAGGTQDWAYLGVNDTGPDSENDDRGYTILGKNGTGGDLTVQATGTDASAEGYIYNATGTVADITVEASGSHEVQGFDLLYFFRPGAAELDLRPGAKITYKVGDHAALEYTVTDADWRNVDGINAMLEKIVVQFNAQADTLDMGVTFESTHLDPLSPFDKGLFATWDTIRDEEAAEIKFISSGVTPVTTTITGNVNYEEYFYTKDGTVNSDAYLDLQTENGGVTADSLTVTASTESSIADTDITGDVAILGDITVSASELSADAYAYINGEDEGTTTLGEMVSGQMVGSAISVTASDTTTEAAAIINNVLGTVDTLTVIASGGNTGSDDFGDRSFACADVAGDFVIQSDITITASGDKAWAMAGVNLVCNDTTTSATMEGGDITVTASGDEALAFSFINNVNGLARDVAVSATGESSDAILWMSTDAEALEMDDLSVLSSAEETQAAAVVSGDVHITGDISVTASGLSALASTDVNGNGEFFFMPFSVGPVIQTELGAGGQASNISVVSSGQGAKAEATIGSGNGTAGNVTVSATGLNIIQKQVYLLNDLEAEIGVDGFSFGNGQTLPIVKTTIKINDVNYVIDNKVFASPDFLAALNAAVEADGLEVHFYTATFDGSVGLVAEWSTPELQDPIQRFRFDDATNGPDVIQGSYYDCTGEEIIGEAAGYFEDSVFVPFTSANYCTDGANSAADLDMHLDGTIAGNLLVEATNELTSADAVINGEVTLEGDITATASGLSSDAVADINWDEVGSTTLAGGDITSTASALDAFADVNIDNAKGTIGQIGMAATSEDAGAYVDIWVDEGQNLTVASISAVTSALAAESELEIDGLSSDSTLTVTGDIFASATSEDAVTDVFLMDDSDNEGRVVLGGGDITMRATAENTDTHVHIQNASGNVGDINMLNTGSNDAEVHLELEADAGRDLTIASITLTDASLTNEIDEQSVQDSEVNIDLWTASTDSEIFITGDISISAVGDYTNARAELNEENVASADTTSNTGTITLGKSVNGQTVGSNITLSAEGDASLAEAVMYNLAGAAGNIRLEASGNRVQTGFQGEFQSILPSELIAAFVTNGAAIDDGYTIVIDGEDYVVEAGTEATREARLNAALPDGVSADFFSWLIQIKWDDELEHAPVAFKFQDSNNEEQTVGLYELNWQLEVESYPYFDAAEAYTEMELDGTVEGDILVKSSGFGSDADMEAGGSITVKGHVEVLASGQESYADLDFNDDDADYSDLGEDNIDFNDNAITTMAAGNYRVAATGTSAYAESQLENAMGSVAALSVEATGESSEADFEAIVEEDKTLTVGSVTVLANSYGQDMAYAEAYLKGETGVDAEQTPWEYLTEDDIDHGTVAITGNITVNALGAFDEAYLQVNAYTGEDGEGNMVWLKDDGYTVLGGGDISIKAAGTHSWAEAMISNARGTAGDITVNAQGAAEVQGFDFLYFFRPADGEMTIGRNQVFTYKVAGEVFTYNITTADFPLNDTVPRAIRINTLLNSIVDSFNDQAEEKGLDVSFSSYYDGPTFDNGLFVTWENQQDNALVEIRLDDTLIAESVEGQNEELIYKDYFFTQDGTEYNDAYLELQNEIRGVTADSLTVTATAESGEAHADILGNVTILGDITVNASELYAEAKAHVNANPTQNVTSVNLFGAFMVLVSEIEGDSFDPITQGVDLVINGEVFNLLVDDYDDPEDFIAAMNQEFESSGISFQWLADPDQNPMLDMISINWPIGQEHGTFELRADGVTIGMDEILEFQLQNDAPDLYVEEEKEVVGEGAEFIGDTVLGGGDITVTSSGSVSYEEAVVSLDTDHVSLAEAVVHNATGSIGSILVSSSGAPLTRDVEGSLGAVSEVQTIDFDTFSTWAGSNDTETTEWTLRVDGGEPGSADDHVFTFTGNDWSDLLDENTTGMGFTFSTDASGDLVITWANGDVYDYDLAVMHGEGTITRGKDWITQELVNEEIHEYDAWAIDTLVGGSSDHSFLAGGEDTAWSINIDGTVFTHTVTSSDDSFESIVDAWNASTDETIDIIYYSNDTVGLSDDWFEVVIRNNEDNNHANISIDYSNSYDVGSDDIISADYMVQSFDSEDVNDILSALQNEDLDSATTWTLTVGGEDYSVNISGDWDANARSLMFDVIESWDTMVSDDGLWLSWSEDDNWFEVVWDGNGDTSLATINITGNDGNIAKEFDIGVIPEYTSQDGVQTGSNWSTPGNQEVQKFYFDKFSNWSSYDTNSSADETITSVSEDWSVSVSPYSNSKGAQFSMLSDDLIDLVSNDDVARLLAAWESATRSGYYDLSIVTGEDDGGKYFTITMGDYDHPNEPSGQSDEFSNHNPARFEVERVITREATWSEDNLTLGEDFEMQDGFSSRTICEHEYIPSIAVLDLEFSGAISGDVTVESTNVAAESYATIHGELSISGDITLRATGDESIAELMINENDSSLDIAFSNDIAVSVTGDDAEATLVLHGLVGETKTLTVNVTGEDALATADLVYNDYGSVKATNINVVHRGEALVTLDQSMENALVQDTGPVGLTPFNTGTVAVSGEGHVGLTYMVDSSAVTAKTIDLRSLNQTMVSGEVTQKTWGYADIDLVAKWENGDAQGPQFTSITTLFPKIMEIKGFNVDRDVINLSHVFDPEMPLPQEAVVSDYVFIDSSDADENVSYFVGGDDTLIRDLETSGVYFEAVQDLLADATAYFSDNFDNSDTKSLGYFYREVEFEFGRGSATVTETRSFLVYDFDLNNSAASGIITFGSTTGLTERNLTERYAIVQEDDSSDTVNTFEDFNNVDLLLAASVLDGDNSASYDLGEDADVMINDIVVTAYETMESDGITFKTSGDVSVDISGDDDSSLQLRQSEILVAADRENSEALLSVSDAWGTVSSLKLHGYLGGVVGASISNIDYMNIQEYQDAISDDDGGEDTNPDAYVGHWDNGLYIHDVEVIADGNLSVATLSLDVDGFVENMTLETLGFGSSIDVVIDQTEFGGEVFISGSDMSEEHASCDCMDEVGSNDVNLAYVNGTAAKIVIDNEGREPLASAQSEDDDSISFNFIYMGEDKDMVQEDAWDQMVTIDGFTQNDTVNLSGEVGSGDNYQNYAGQLLDFDEEGQNTLLRNAFEALENVDYYFGQMGGNGYLFHDQDGDGLTMIVEFLGVTTFDYTKIIGSTPT